MLNALTQSNCSQIPVWALEPLGRVLALIGDKLSIGDSELDPAILADNPLPCFSVKIVLGCDNQSLGEEEASALHLVGQVALGIVPREGDNRYVRGE